MRTGFESGKTDEFFLGVFFGVFCRSTTHVVDMLFCNLIIFERLPDARGVVFGALIFPFFPLRAKLMLRVLNAMWRIRFHFRLFVRSLFKTRGKDS